MNTNLLGITSALICAMSWAICSLLFKKLGNKLKAIEMATIKTVFSGIILLFIALLCRADLTIEINNLHIVGISSILGIAIGDSLFFASLSKLSPFMLSSILFASPVILSAIFGFFFLNETLSVITLIAIIALLLGLSLLIFPIKDKNNTKTKFLGIILALASLIFTTYSMVLIKPILINHSTLTITMYRMFFSALVLMVFCIATKKISTIQTAFKDKCYAFKLIGTILIATLGGFWLSLVSIKHCKLAIASSVMSLEPLFALIFMILFYKYKAKLKEFVGIFIIITALLLLYLE